ncbi:MAG TPA: tyrosine-protein phosphatase [Chloroflexia bacterium]|jgi:protein tyrosine/serine phosphatase
MSKEEEQTRYLAWDACYNAREVGGYPAANGRHTRWRALVRADNLHRLTPEGQAALRDYGVRTIIDLRMAHELEMHPNPFAGQGTGDGPRYLHLPLLDSDTDAAFDAAQAAGSEYIVIVERGKELVATVIKAVAASLKEGGVLVHCHGGKDRTGIVVALLLSLVGVPRETIAEDYAISEARLEPAHSEWLEEQAKLHGHPVERPHWMYSRPEKMAGLLAYLDQHYGGVEGYLEACGVTQDEMAQIRKHLIAPAREAGE